MKSFGYAFKGIRHAVKTQRHMRIHLCFAFYVILAGLITQLNTAQWSAILICIGLVTSFECMNTALENACDAITSRSDPLIGAAKDVAAGAVLVTAVISAIVGIGIFFCMEKLRLAWNFLLYHPFWSALIIFSLVPWIVFIFEKKT